MMMYINAENLEERGEGRGGGGGGEGRQRASQMTALILITGTKETCSKIRNTGQKMKQAKIQTQHSMFSKNELVQI